MHRLRAIPVSQWRAGEVGRPVVAAAQAIVGIDVVACRLDQLFLQVSPRGVGLVRVVRRSFRFRLGKRLRGGGMRPQRDMCATPEFRRLEQRPRSNKCVFAAVAGPEIVERLRREPSFGPASTKFWPMLADLGKQLDMSDQQWPGWANCWPMLANLTNDHFRPMLVENWSDLGNVYQPVVSSWLNSAKVGRIWANFGQFGPTSNNTLPS